MASILTDARIDSDGFIITHAIVEDYLTYRARVFKDVFVWTANIVPTANTNVIWIRNASQTKELRLQRITVYCNATCELATYYGTGNTAGGTVVLGHNTYLGQPDDQGAACYYQNTNVDAGAGMTKMENLRVGATNEEGIDLDGALTMPYNYEFALECITNIDQVKVNIMGFFDPPAEQAL